MVGGLDRVYEINRNFRNEGVSTQHNPEFTMLEFYQAYANYHDLMQLTQELIIQVALEVNGTTVTNFAGQEIDLSKWRRFSMREAILEFWPEAAGPKPALEDFASDHAVEQMAERVREARISLEFKPGQPAGKTIAGIFEAIAEDHLIQPTIIYDFPVAVSPLSKNKPEEPEWVERFEFYIGGFELGNAFSELNDPEEQRRRFEQQLGERERGDTEAHVMDEDYVRALAYGLPPTGGRRDRHRPPDHGAHRREIDSGRNPVPAAARPVRRRQQLLKPCPIQPRPAPAPTAAARQTAGRPSAGALSLARRFAHALEHLAQAGFLKIVQQRYHGAGENLLERRVYPQCRRGVDIGSVEKRPRLHRLVNIRQRDSLRRFQQS